MGLISLYIDDKVKNKVKSLGIRHSGVYMRGFEGIVNKSSYEEAILELRKRLERMSHLLDHYVVKCVALEDELKGVKKDVLAKQKKNRK